MFSSVRGRITLVATTVVGLALLVASILILDLVEADLLDATERALEAELELDAAEFDFDGEPQFFEFSLDGRDLSLGVFIEDEFFAVGSVFDDDGLPVADVLLDPDGLQVIDISDPITGLPIDNPDLANELEELAFEVQDIDGDAGNTLLVGAVARDEVDASLAAVRDALIIIVPAFTALMGMLIWWLVGRALRPVQAISDQVQAISTSSLGQRVPVPGGNDEISGLATVMNGMLSRLQRGDERQRQFAADASHELRSPLSTVRAAAEMIERNPSSERAPGLASDIVAESDRMDTLIGDLLALSRIDEESAGSAHAAIDLGAIVDRFDAVERSVEPGVAVTGDPRELTRAISNLVNNAQRHAADRVRVALRTVDHAGVAYAELSVEDDGEGVPADQRSEIFERFSRLDEARSRDRGGSGLGLALVQAIVARHRGSVQVTESESLGGARFVIHVPCTEAPQPETF